MGTRSMKPKNIFIAATVAAIAVAGYLYFQNGAFAGPPLQPERVDLDRGKTLYAQTCAACHGANLEGQENWQAQGSGETPPAPPHDETGHTWHHGDALLFTYTKLGGEAALAQKGIEFTSGMPGFGEMLTDQEIWDILAFIKSTWSDRIREVQAVRTEAEQLRGN